jgi:hypothetical protein
MAKILEIHRTLAHKVFMMGELHGLEELKKAIAQAIADAEERGQQEARDLEKPSV